ncbi:MAG: hypothetical protein OEZ36_12430, partial [Spirochaetota bacterium]|nr:hypothetical protein [Spirochaetota bacterium]
KSIASVDGFERRMAGVVSGDLEAKSLALSIDTVNNMEWPTLKGMVVGPDVTLQVKSVRTDFSGRLSVQGAVGIGTSDPSHKLSVNGSFLVENNASIKGNCTIDGDLMVRGRSEVVNTLEIEVSDSIIRVNKYDPLVVPREINGGLEVYRGGTEPNAQVIWDETEDKWKVGLENQLFEIPYGPFSVSPEGNVGIGISDPTTKLSVNGSLHVVNNAEVLGNCNINGDLTINGRIDTPSLSNLIDLSCRVSALMNPDQASACTHYTQGFVMKDGSIKLGGGTTNGIHGNGDYQSHHVRPVTPTFQGVNTGPIKSVHLTYTGAHALTESGEIWGWGYNGHGQVGDGSVTQRNVPTPVNWGSNAKPNIIKIVSTHGSNGEGSISWYGLDDSGNVWSWGYNGFGQLAIGNSTNQTAPSRTSLTGVIDIEAAGGDRGWVHAITSDGSAYSAGYNHLGYLGYGGGHSNIWKKVNLPAPCVKISSTGCAYSDGYTYGHTLWLLADGRVFSAGYNGYGQCGNGTNTHVNNGAVEITSLSNITAIWTGGSLYGSSFALNTNGDLFGWGYNGYGQLGIGPNMGSTNIPKPNPIKNVTSLRIGGYGSCNHTLLLTNSGEAYGSGYNGYGQLGRGHYAAHNNYHELVHLPYSAQGNVVQIGVSGHSNATASQFLDQDGHVWVCGNNGYNQLCANPSFGDRVTIPTRVMF